MMDRESVGRGRVDEDDGEQWRQFPVVVCCGKRTSARGLPFLAPYARATPAPAPPNRNAHRQRFVYWVYARHARVATICARGSTQLVRNTSVTVCTTADNTLIPWSPDPRAPPSGFQGPVRREQLGRVVIKTSNSQYLCPLETILSPSRATSYICTLAYISSVLRYKIIT